MWAETAQKRIGRLFRRKLRCSFCGRSAAEVGRLVAGASGYICDECITIASRYWSNMAASRQ